MRLVLAIVCMVSFGVESIQSQDGPALLKTTGWGSLSGKVFDAKTKKPIADAVVFLKAPDGKYFPIHEEDKKRKVLVVQLPQGGKLKFAMLLHYPHYLDGSKEVSTGEKLELRGDAVQDHIINWATRPKPFSTYAKAGSKTYVELTPGLLPSSMQNARYSEMRAYVYTFNHPFHAITDRDGSYRIPRVPAGAEIAIMGWHEDVGWLLTKKGKKQTLNVGMNVFNIEVER